MRPSRRPSNRYPHRSKAKRRQPLRDAGPPKNVHIASYSPGSAFPIFVPHFSGKAFQLRSSLGNLGLRFPPSLLSTRLDLFLQNLQHLGPRCWILAQFVGDSNCQATKKSHNSTGSVLGPSSPFPATGLYFRRWACPKSKSCSNRSGKRPAPEDDISSLNHCRRLKVFRSLRFKQTTKGSAARCGRTLWIFGGLRCGNPVQVALRLSPLGYLEPERGRQTVTIAPTYVNF